MNNGKSFATADAGTRLLRISAITPVQALQNGDCLWCTEVSSHWSMLKGSSRAPILSDCCHTSGRSAPGATYSYWLLYVAAFPILADSPPSPTTSVVTLHGRRDFIRQSRFSVKFTSGKLMTFHRSLLHDSASHGELPWYLDTPFRSAR